MITEELLFDLKEFVNRKLLNDMNCICKCLEVNIEILPGDYSLEEEKVTSESLRNIKRSSAAENKMHAEIQQYIQKQSAKTFTQLLFDYIDKIDATDADIYKKAGIDKKHFSKIRTNPNYKPRKSTVIGLILALELDKDNACRLLDSAGYSLTNSDIYDLIILFCLERNVYDIHDVNIALDSFNLKPL